MQFSHYKWAQGSKKGQICDFEEASNHLRNPHFDKELLEKVYIRKKKAISI